MKRGRLGTGLDPPDGDVAPLSAPFQTPDIMIVAATIFACRQDGSRLPDETGTIPVRAVAAAPTESACQATYVERAGRQQPASGRAHAPYAKAPLMGRTATDRVAPSRPSKMYDAKSPARIKPGGAIWSLRTFRTLKSGPHHPVGGNGGARRRRNQAREDAAGANHHAQRMCEGEACQCRRHRE